MTNFKPKLLLSRRGLKADSARTKLYGLS